MKLNLAAVILLSACLAMGCASVGPASEEPAEREFPQVATENLDGRGLFLAFCSNCHDPTGRGTDMGKSLIDEQAMALTDEQILETIAKGREDLGMMVFGGNLTPEEIGKAAGYVRELQGRNPRRLALQSSAPQPVPTAPAAAAGAVAAGRTLFSETAMCSMCHSVGSEGGDMGPAMDGVASRLDANEIRAALEDPSATIAEGYRVKKAVTKDGRTVEGRVRNETDATLQILSPSGQTWVTYIKARLESLEVSPKSQMPALVFTRLAEAEQESLLAYLATLK